jgi:phenylacetate-CoA ligase
MAGSTDTTSMDGRAIAYRNHVDFDDLDFRHPLPHRFITEVMRWSAERMREHQEILFADVVKRAWENKFYQELWGRAGIEPGDIRGLGDVEGLPVITQDHFRKSLAECSPFGLHASQAFASRSTVPLKIQSSGGTTGAPRPTFFDPVETEVQGIQVARALLAQGIQAGDIMQIPVTLALANLGWIYYRACHNYLGVIPITTGSGKVTPSRVQLELAARWGSNVWGGFPDYQLRLAEVAASTGFDLVSLKTRFINSHLGADPGDVIRNRLRTLWNCPVYDMYGTHEVGVIAFESEAREGLHFSEDTAFVECLDPVSHDPVSAGERGNVVVTSLYRRNPPLIRYDLGDQTILLPETTGANGYRRRRMTRFLGRSDDVVKIRGTNVSPESCAESLSGYAGRVGEWLCVAMRERKDDGHVDQITIKVETRERSNAFADELRTTLSRDLGLPVAVELVEPGALAGHTRADSEGERKVRRILDLRDK